MDRPTSLQNRITPFGAPIVHPARGGMMGNRGGRIHDPATRQLTRRRWASKRWIACVLEFKNRQRTVWGDSYTELFFLDEATALTAGHRPCYECRRADAKKFANAWAAAFDLNSAPTADDMDAVLHRERTQQMRPSMRRRDLANGAMIADARTQARDPSPFLFWGEQFYRWRPDGYEPSPPPADYALITPPSVLAVYHAGYQPDHHPFG